MEDCKKSYKSVENNGTLIYNGELLSVVVPVYNISKYIRRCVESIINQSYKNLEIILVNDCSTDGCAEICEELAAGDNRIKALHHTVNQGLSVSRNTGIEASTADYIAFIDGDDYVVVDYIARLYGLMKEYNADISITSFIKEYEESGKRKPESKQALYTMVFEKQKTMEAYLYQKHFITSAWGRLFKKTVIDGIPFPPGRINEDIGVFYKYIDRADRVVYCSSPDYIYIQRATSILRTKQAEMKRDYIELADEMLAFMEKKYPHLREACISRCFSANIKVFMNIPLSRIYCDENKDIINNIKKYRKSVFRNPKARLVNKGCAGLSYIGMWMLKIALGIIGSA
jgi:raffinose-raffinose alpha-galactotransferase